MKKDIELQTDEESHEYLYELFGKIEIPEDKEERELETLKRHQFEEKCAIIFNLLLESDIKMIISGMIEMYDKKGVFYEHFNAENILKKSLSNISVVFDSIEKLSLEETKDWEKEYEYITNDDLLLESKDQYRESCISHTRECIINYILGVIQEEAHKKRFSRVYVRKEKGTLIDFNECECFMPHNNYVEFYKDGGWGIATSDGVVKITNIIITQPSRCRYDDYVSFDKSFRIVQSCDTYRYGVISISSYEIIIPLIYKKIEDFGEWDKRPLCSLIKVLDDNGWGCFNDKGINVIECKYDNIELLNDYLECFRDGDYIKNEELSVNGGEVFYDGKRDLYDKNGNLLIGGYSLRNHYLSDIYYYYFDILYESYYVKESDLWDRGQIELCKYRINFDKAACLILNSHFKSVFKINGTYFQYPIGKCIESIQDLKLIVPERNLLFHEVNFWDGEFVFQNHRLGEKKMVEVTKQVKTYKPHIRPATEVERAASMLFDNVEIETVKEDYIYEKVTEKELEEDDLVIITCLSDKNEILWEATVNELGKLNGSWLFAYRKGGMVGFYSKNGLEEARFNAITIKNGLYYVAQVVIKNEDANTCNNNPNFLGSFSEDIEDENGGVVSINKNVFIKYYQYVNKELIEICDDWKIFNPAKLNWFPNTFKTQYHIYDYDDGPCYSDYGPDIGCEWTDEDAWDAMTDGMYGDYPGSGWDSEWFGN